jgi:hypothetical protein
MGSGAAAALRCARVWLVWLLRLASPNCTNSGYRQLAAGIGSWHRQLVFLFLFLGKPETREVSQEVEVGTVSVSVSVSRFT